MRELSGVSVESQAEKGLEARMPRRERVEMLTFDPYHAPRRRTEECILLSGSGLPAARLASKGRYTACSTR